MEEYMYGQIAEITKLMRDQYMPQADAVNEDAWITARGTHMPITPSGKVVGGPLEGENFKNAKSQPSGG